MQNVKALLSDIDNHNRKVKQSHEKTFHDRVESGVKDKIKRFVGVTTFGYSPDYSKNYDKIQWR